MAGSGRPLTGREGFGIAGSEKTADPKGGFWGIAGASSRSVREETNRKEEAKKEEWKGEML